MPAYNGLTVTLPTQSGNFDITWPVMVEEARHADGLDGVLGTAFLFHTNVAQATVSLLPGNSFRFFSRLSGISIS